MVLGPLQKNSVSHLDWDEFWKEC